MRLSPRALCAAAATLAVLAAPSIARAQPSAPPDPDPAFRYVTPRRPNHARAALEELVLIGVGFGEYSTDQANSADWELSYDWESLQKKVTLQAWSFDDNRFTTNWVWHPFAGYTYYAMARGNRASVAASIAMSFAASSLWETFGEFKENVAINDLVVTSLGGMPIAEASTQIGALFHRSRHSTEATLLGWLFAPSKSAHDGIDGLTPAPAPSYDDMGFPTDVWHRFTFSMGGGVSAFDSARASSRLGAEARVVSLPFYEGAGRTSAWFHSAEVSRLAAQVGWADGGLVDIDIASHVLPFGWYEQDVGRDEHGRLAGSSALVGFHVGYSFTSHDEERDGERRTDQIALVALGTTLETSARAGAVTARAHLDALGTFGGVDAYALPAYLAGNGRGLTSVLREKGYYHAVGATLRPAAELEVGPVDAGAELGADWFRAITAVDGVPDGAARVGATDRRVTMRGWIGASPAQHLRVGVSAERREREGTVGRVRGARVERSLFGEVALRF